MKHLWALLSTLTLSIAIVVSGVAAWAANDAPDSQDANTAAAQAPTLSAVDGPGLFPVLTAPQDVLPGTVLLTRTGAHPGSRGTRSDQQFFQISSTGSNDVPAAALRAYRHAEAVMATTDPGCKISWTLLAAIGRVESNHGRFGGAQLGSDGVSRPGILGPQLNGGAFAAIRDTDHGALDHDTVWDRAVGQMQFLPQTWHSVARDGDGDGVMNPNDIDDSALGAAVYLCGVGGSLAVPAGAARAAFRYNHSDYYVKLVLSFQTGYQTGVFAQPSPPPPPKPMAKAKRVRTTATSPQAKPRTKKTVAVHPTSPVPTAKPTSKPAPKPGPTPTPTPSGPKLVQLDGTWNTCPAGYCLDTTPLDLGSASVLGDRASADFDGDGTVETNSIEFTGLAGKQVTLQVNRTTGAPVVYVIDGIGYRNADGSFARTIAAPNATTTP